MIEKNSTTKELFQVRYAKKKCVRAFYELSPINGLTFPPD